MYASSGLAENRRVSLQNALREVNAESESLSVSDTVGETQAAPCEPLKAVTDRSKGFSDLFESEFDTSLCFLYPNISPHVLRK